MRICLSDSTTNFGNGIMNTFSYIIMNAIWVFLMWTVVFTALKSAKMTEWFVQGVQDFAQTAMKSAPIIYVPGLWMQSAGSLGKAKDTILSEPQRRLQNQQREMQNLMWDNAAERSQKSKDLRAKIDAWVSEKAKANTAVKQIMTEGVTTGTDFEDYNNMPQVLWRSADKDINTMEWVFADADVTNKIVELWGEDGLSKFRSQMVKNTHATASANKQKKLYKSMVTGLSSGASGWDIIYGWPNDVKTSFMSRDKKKLLHLDQTNMWNDKTISLWDGDPSEMIAALWTGSVFGDDWQSRLDDVDLKKTLNQLAGKESIAGIWHRSWGPHPADTNLSLIYNSNTKRIVSAVPSGSVQASDIKTSEYLIWVSQDATSMVTTTGTVTVWTKK